VTGAGISGGTELGMTVGAETGSEFSIETGMDTGADRGIAGSGTGSDPGNNPVGSGSAGMSDPIGGRPFDGVGLGAAGFDPSALGGIVPVAVVMRGPVAGVVRVVVVPELVLLSSGWVRTVSFDPPNTGAGDHGSGRMNKPTRVRTVAAMARAVISIGRMLARRTSQLYRQFHPGGGSCSIAGSERSSLNTSSCQSQSAFSGPSSGAGWARLPALGRVSLVDPLMPPDPSVADRVDEPPLRVVIPGDRVRCHVFEDGEDVLADGDVPTRV
jgi:hypothetical protein